MAIDEGRRRWKGLDKDLNRIGHVEYAVQSIWAPLAAPGAAAAFIALAALLSAVYFGLADTPMIVILAAAFGAYMALNIGANDVANNMGPAVGSKALTMGSALVIAAVCETAGALIAGGDVVSTISKSIIDPAAVASPDVFVWAMMAALISSALWVNLATYLGAPVSTTHSVVGGVMGAGIAAAGISVVNWATMGSIAASWIVSPLLGGGIAAGFLAFIKWKIAYQDDMIEAARRWVPILIALMVGVFATYLALKGLKAVIAIDLPLALLIGIGCGAVAYGGAVPLIRRQAEGLENRKRSLRGLFSLPLVLSAGLLSFAHGANDVANAVGPLAAIVAVSQTGAVTDAVTIPIWVMVIGAFGISLGLFLFGPKLIRMVGDQITKLNPVRAYCVALSAAITVIIASWLGLPVSSTHIAVGGVFGVGFFREWDAERRSRLKAGRPRRAKRVDVEERKRRKLVRRSHFMTIVAAWVITVPAAALLSATIYLAIGLLVH
ncbi:inorganic phosphate transporter [Acuticoccus sp. M5D2P5]|uniref:inorganic phosphate transporter n=1 Tax=Acuticoccus kalidii TaxID=2910977 RepID=UPI001F358A26|nr:inorganic phosphate transporter [Acuticoccus kalidii]